VTPQASSISREMSRGRLAIAMRYHAGVTAIVAERPVVLIGYAPKVAALASALGPDCRYLARDSAAIAQLPQAVIELLERSHDSVRTHRIRLQDAERMNEEVLAQFLGSCLGTRRSISRET
jgi:polysaccharide pyruvyl transferase WcaK-like protein